MDTLIIELIELVKQTAPELWRIAMQQVLARTVQCAAGLLFGLLVLLVTYILIKKTRERQISKENRYDDDGWTMVSFLINGFVAMCAVFYVAAAIDNLIGLLISPEYYAIQALIKLVK